MFEEEREFVVGEMQMESLFLCLRTEDKCVKKIKMCLIRIWIPRNFWLSYFFFNVMGP